MSGRGLPSLALNEGRLASLLRHRSLLNRGPLATRGRGVRTCRSAVEHCRPRDGLCVYRWSSRSASRPRKVRRFSDDKMVHRLSVGHQHGGGHRLPQAARRSAEDSLGPARMPARSHHDQVDTQIGGSRQQGIGNADLGRFEMGIRGHTLQSSQRCKASRRAAIDGVACPSRSCQASTWTCSAQRRSGSASVIARVASRLSSQAISTLDPMLARRPA